MKEIFSLEINNNSNLDENQFVVIQSGHDEKSGEAMIPNVVIPIVVFQVKHFSLN